MNEWMNGHFTTVMTDTNVPQYCPSTQYSNKQNKTIKTNNVIQHNTTNTQQWLKLMNESHRARAEPRSAETESARGSPWPSHRSRAIPNLPPRGLKEQRNSARRAATTRYCLSDADRMERRARYKNPARMNRRDKAAGPTVISASRDAPLTAADATPHSTWRVTKSTCARANLENSVKLLNCEMNETKIPFTANDTGAPNTSELSVSLMERSFKTSAKKNIYRLRH